MMPPGGMVPPGAIQPGAAGPAWTPMEAYGFAWRLVTKRFGAVAVPLVVGFVVLYAILGVFYGGLIVGPQVLVQQGVLDASLAVGATYAGMSGVVIIVILVEAYMLGGFATVALKAVRGQPTAIGDVFSGGRYFLTNFVGLLVFVILFFFGEILCLVPAFIFACGCWAWGYLVVDQGLGGVDALKRSWEMMKGHKMNMFIWMILTFFVNLAGELACLLPLFLISLPMVVTSSAWIYLRIKGEHVPEPT